MTSYRKYKNIPTELDGINFDSKKEARRYQDLKLLQMGNVISNLEIQPVIPLMVNGTKIGRYTGDFKYIEKAQQQKLEIICYEKKY